MKYSDKNKPLVCMQTQSTCYKNTRTMTVRGVLWHSTGANNPNLMRYVQPSDNDPDRAELLGLLGTNRSKNDWNHVTRQAGLNAWIGKLANGRIAAVQTMPWHYRPWGCGGGKKGSCNDGWIQFEICEDALTSSTYFASVYREACELTAYLCRLYNIDPHGSVTLNGVKVPTILCHHDSYYLGLGCNHGDIDHWFPKFKKSMATARADVAALLKADTSPVSPPPAPSTVAEVPFLVKVSVNNLNIRSGPGTNCHVNGILPPGSYTIVELADGPGASAWGKLKSGAGWISMDYAQIKR